MQQDLAGFGASPQLLARYESEATEQPPFEVLPANWLAVQIFNDCSGQWARDHSNMPVAIKRHALHCSLDLWPVEPAQRSDTFHRVRVMEATAASEYRRRAARR